MIKIFLGTLLISVIGFTFVFSINNEQSSLYKKITFEKMDEMIKENSNYIILDVRTEAEFNQGHVPNSILIPDYEIEKITSLYSDKSLTIFVYCRSGNRSKTATNNLLNMGYERVYDVGGIINYPNDLEITYNN